MGKFTGAADGGARRAAQGVARVSKAPWEKKNPAGERGVSQMFGVIVRTLREMGGGPGAGLGLSLVVAIVKLHGFRLTIHPGPGFVAEIDFEQGSTFDQAPAVSATTR